MIQPKRMFSAPFVGVFGLLGPVLTATAPVQTVVVTAKSIKDLAGDLEYLVKTVAPEGDANVENILGAPSSSSRATWSRAWTSPAASAWRWPCLRTSPAGGPPSIVAAVPVTDLGAFLDSIKGLGIAVDDQPGVAGFSHKVTAPDGNTNLFVLAIEGLCPFLVGPEALTNSRRWTLASGRRRTAGGSLAARSGSRSFPGARGPVPRADEGRARPAGRAQARGG